MDSIINRSYWTMLEAYPSVIHASLILTDMHGYHTQLSMVTSGIDMISVIFIRGKSLKLHAPMSMHTTGMSPPSLALTASPILVCLSIFVMFF